MIRLVWLSLFAVCVATSGSASTLDAKERMRLALENFETSVSGVSGWLAEYYDPASGGFFESPELKTLPGAWGPDIQSTTQVLAIVFENERVHLLPALARQRLLRFYHQRQQPDGWFIDPHYPQMRELPRIRARALGFGLNSLRQLGSQPRYPIPGSNVQATPASHLDSPASVTAWIEALDWTNPWAALARLSAEGPVFAAIPTERRDAIVDAALAAIRKHYNPMTGLYGEGTLEVQISGAAKLGWFCQKVGRHYPTPEASEEILLTWIRSKPEVDRATIIRNTVQHLEDLQAWLRQPTSEMDRAMVIEWAASAITRFAVNGAFNMESDHSHWLIQPNDLRDLASYPDPVGSINGTAQVLRVRGKAYALAGITEPTLPNLERLIQVMTAESSTDGRTTDVDQTVKR